MTHRTKTGNSLRKHTKRARKHAAAKNGGSPLAGLGPVVWSFGLLTLSVALAAAAVFTHRA